MHSNRATLKTKGGREHFYSMVLSCLVRGTDIKFDFGDL